MAQAQRTRGRRTPPPAQTFSRDINVPSDSPYLGAGGTITGLPGLEGMTPQQANELLRSQIDTAGQDNLHQETMRKIADIGEPTARGISMASDVGSLAIPAFGGARLLKAGLMKGPNVVRGLVGGPNALARPAATAEKAIQGFGQVQRGAAMRRPVAGALGLTGALAASSIDPEQIARSVETEPGPQGRPIPPIETPPDPRGQMAPTLPAAAQEAQPQDEIGQILQYLSSQGQPQMQGRDTSGMESILAQAFQPNPAIPTLEEEQMADPLYKRILRSVSDFGRAYGGESREQIQNQRQSNRLAEQQVQRGNQGFDERQKTAVDYALNSTRGAEQAQDQFGVSSALAEQGGDQAIEQMLLASGLEGPAQESQQRTQMINAMLQSPVGQQILEQLLGQQMGQDINLSPEDYEELLNRANPLRSLNDIDSLLQSLGPPQ